MKQQLATLFLTAATLLITTVFSPAVFAHGGHAENASIHSFLHIEHIVLLVVIGIAGYLLKSLRDR